MYLSSGKYLSKKLVFGVSRIQGKNVQLFQSFVLGFLSIKVEIRLFLGAVFYPI